jgi:hypothetical protein
LVLNFFFQGFFFLDPDFFLFLALSLFSPFSDCCEEEVLVVLVVARRAAESWVLLSLLVRFLLEESSASTLRSLETMKLRPKSSTFDRAENPQNKVSNPHFNAFTKPNSDWRQLLMTMRDSNTFK